MLRLFAQTAVPPSALAAETDSAAIVQTFLTLFNEDTKQYETALKHIKKTWQPSYVPMVLETIYLQRDGLMRLKLYNILLERTGSSLGYGMQRWNNWLWNEPEMLHPDYHSFKASLYALIDPRFSDYFAEQMPRKIRLDEVVWGGVRQDGIPPLRQPKMIKAAEAEYLQEDNIVFGIEVNGDARAYPKRIMAWHEMFVDTVGGEPVTGVYCTLCGAMILYKSTIGGVVHDLGTSGFLYRSNKLMYDKQTNSLWNTIWGEPVVGSLVNQGLVLERLGIVTTSWREWRQRHPQTQVLDIETGHARDYSEGAAYRQYFATDELMFQVPKLDQRLANKAEVLGLVFATSVEKPLAIAVSYLQANPLYHHQVGATKFVVLTDQSGASRVYESAEVVFKNWDRQTSLRDTQATEWTMTEAALVSSNGRKLTRLPAHRSFWFGWYSAYSHTALVY